MNRKLEDKIRDLREILNGMEHVAVAVSGGVDSMTLSVAAHRLSCASTEMFHAVSPAVPVNATKRVKAYAAREGWNLRMLDAGEFANGNYMRNPVNRCYFCKSSLYGSVSEMTKAMVVSGTNLDDLDDYRPGLRAAREHAVRHPYVEAGIDKSAVRHIAQHLGLRDLAELPAAPCLSSRIETGIGIDPGVLVAVDRVEQWLVAELKPRTARCRVRDRGVVIELDKESFSALTTERRQSVTDAVIGVFRGAGFSPQVLFAPYRMGSAFVRPPTVG